MSTHDSSSDGVELARKDDMSSDSRRNNTFKHIPHGTTGFQEKRPVFRSKLK